MVGMAPNPQLENGFTRLSNEIIEALARLRLSGEENQCLWVIFRQTYGWGKKEDQISLGQFSLMTGLIKQHVLRALNKLSSKTVITITKNGNGQPNTYKFIKDFGKWKPLPKKVQVPKMVKDVTKNGNEALPKMVNTKERKEKKEKGDSMASSKALDRFLKDKALEIYEAYPRKADRPNSLKSIEKILRAYPVELLPCPVPGLKTVIRNYQKHLEAEGTEKKFIIQSNNFFGLAERWRESLQDPRAQVSTW